MSEDRLQGNTARMLKTDKRLRAAADWVEPCDIIADIGCDHGRLGAMLLLENRAKHLIASDISEKSLQKAKHCLQRHGLTGRAEFTVADGLEALDQKVDTVCILGMGGETSQRHPDPRAGQAQQGAIAGAGRAYQPVRRT